MHGMFMLAGSQIKGIWARDLLEGTSHQAWPLRLVYRTEITRLRSASPLIVCHQIMRLRIGGSYPVTARLVKISVRPARPWHNSVDAHYFEFNHMGLRVPTSSTTN